jgi:hypothetical protein
MASPISRFVGGASGAWQVTAIEAVRGEGFERPSRLDVLGEGQAAQDRAARWVLRGSASNARYSTRGELTTLGARQSGLGRAESTRAALIPVRKSERWWALAQDERRAILERSRHIEIGLDYLPAIARRLHHSRDLGEDFDFLTWFEFAPADAGAFDDLLARLRATEEWTFVEPEVVVRLERARLPWLGDEPVCVFAQGPCVDPGCRDPGRVDSM